MDVKLVMFKANGQRREYAVAQAATLIGRSTECQLQIPLGTVSRRHCTITIQGNDVAVQDAGSSNGTFVNDQRIQETPLNAGDTLVVGPVIFTVVINGQPEQIKPIRTIIVEQSVEPVAAAAANDGGTVDQEVEAEQIGKEAAPADPLAALQSMSKPAKK